MVGSENPWSSKDNHGNRNVFKRLSTSPSKVYSGNISKPPTRVSPLRKSPARQLTPKRLASPTCLRSYVPVNTHEDLQMSRSEKIEKNGRATSLVFPTSPTKILFSNEKRIGGDGSLSKLRSRFSNGLLSPQRLAATSHNAMDIQGKNLFGSLQDLEHEISNNPTEINVQEQEKPVAALGQETKSMKSPNKKKTVKFEIPSSDMNTLKDELTDIKALLKEVAAQQRHLESRLVTLENKLNDKKGNK